MSATDATPSESEDCAGRAMAKILATESAERGFARLVARPIPKARPIENPLLSTDNVASAALRFPARTISLVPE